MGHDYIVCFVRNFILTLMNLLPKLKKCPSCESVNLVALNGIMYENPFHSLENWTLKKKFNCRRCKVELGLFFHNKNHEEKTVWLEYFQYDDDYYDEINKLKIHTVKNRKNKKKYLEVLEKIEKIEKFIQAKKIKLKIKRKIENKGMLISRFQ